MYIECLRTKWAPYHLSQPWLSFIRVNNFHWAGSVRAQWLALTNWCNRSCCLRILDRTDNNQRPMNKSMHNPWPTNSKGKDDVNNKILSQPTGQHFNLPGHSLANMNVTILEKVKKNGQNVQERKRKISH